MYDNKTKESARCWCWNQVCQRVLSKGETVMVLIGDTDCELREGLRRGMNVIGIDRSANSVESFRKSGGVAVNDDFIVQMKNIKPGAVIFDGVSGLTKYSFDLISAASKYTNAIVWNGLRGRDPLAAPVKSEFSGIEIDVYNKGRYIGKRDPGIHRAMLLYSASVGVQVDNIDRDYSLQGKKTDWYYPPHVSTYEDMRRYEEATLRRIVTRWNKPEFMTYRSKDSRQYFDTGAWTTWPAKESCEKSTHGDIKSIRKSAAAKVLLLKQLGKLIETNPSLRQIAKR